MTRLSRLVRMCALALFASMTCLTVAGAVSANERGAVTPPISPSSATAAAAAPTDSIRVDEGARFTRDLDVSIQVGPASGDRVIDAVRLANQLVDGQLDDPVDASRIQAVPWSLDGGADGQRTVYAQVHYAGGDWSDVMPDSITLDTTAPSGTVEITNEFMASGDPWSAKMAGFELPFLLMRVQDASFAAGGDVPRIRIGSNDLPLRERQPDNSTRARDGDQIAFTDWYDITTDYDEPRGTITIKVRWQDEAGNWSDVATDSYEMLQFEQPATLFADGQQVPPDYIDSTRPPPATNDATDMELRVRIDYLPVGPDGQSGTVDELWVSGAHDGPWKKFAWGDGSSRTVDWSLIDTRYGYTAGDGGKHIYVRLRPSIGRDRTLTLTVVLDRVTPTSDEPVTAAAIGSIVGTGGDTAKRGASMTAAATPTITGVVVWKGSDQRSGVGSYRLQRSTNGAAWKSQDLERPTASTTKASLSASDQYQFRVRTFDRAGNSSSWKTGLSLSPTIIPESSSSIRYTGNWTSVQRTDALGGRLRSTTTIGGSASLTFTGTGVAWVAPRRPNGDAAEVWIDGKKVKVAQLVASSYQPRRVVFSTAWAKRARHTIKIVHRHSGHELPLDAFIVLR